jgi:hypothetical protein
MNISLTQYTDTTKQTIKATIGDTEVFVPTDPDNRHYAEILKQVKEGTLTIKDAD